MLHHLTSLGGAPVAPWFAALLAGLCLAGLGQAPRKPGDYPLTADSLPQPGVPAAGRLEGPFEFRSQVIAGTGGATGCCAGAVHGRAVPAHVLVIFQDGRATKTGLLRVPQVLENPVHKGEIR